METASLVDGDRTGMNQPYQNQGFTGPQDPSRFPSQQSKRLSFDSYNSNSQHIQRNYPIQNHYDKSTSKPYATSQYPGSPATTGGLTPVVPQHRLRSPSSITSPAAGTNGHNSRRDSSGATAVGTPPAGSVRTSALSPCLEDDMDENPMSWKLLHDPVLEREKHKRGLPSSFSSSKINPLVTNPNSNLFRLDGKIIAVDSPTRYKQIKTLNEKVDCHKDPRHRLFRKHIRRSFRLAKFDVDSNFIGKLPNKVLVLTRLSLNMTKSELEDEFYHLWGEQHIEKVSLYNPPQAPVSTGLAKIVFKSASKCRQAQQYINNRAIWKSNCVHACFDPKGSWLRVLYDYIVSGNIDPAEAPTQVEFTNRKHVTGNSRQPVERTQRRKNSEQFSSAQPIPKQHDKPISKQHLMNLAEQARKMAEANRMAAILSQAAHNDEQRNSSMTPDSQRSSGNRTPSPHTPNSDMDEENRPHTPKMEDVPVEQDKTYERTPSPELSRRTSQDRHYPHAYSSGHQNARSAQQPAYESDRRRPNDYRYRGTDYEQRYPEDQRYAEEPQVEQKPALPPAPPPRVRAEVRRHKAGDFMMEQVSSYVFNLLLARDLRRKFVLTVQNHAMNDLLNKVQQKQKERAAAARQKLEKSTKIVVDTGAQLKRRLEEAVAFQKPKRPRPNTDHPSNKAGVLKVEDIWSSSDEDGERRTGTDSEEEHSDIEEDAGEEAFLLSPASPLPDPLYDSQVNFINDVALGPHCYVNAAGKSRSKYTPAQSQDREFFENLDANIVDDNPEFYRRRALDWFLGLNRKRAHEVWRQIEDIFDTATDSFDYTAVLLKQTDPGQEICLLDEEDLEFFNIQLKQALPALPFSTKIAPPEPLPPSYDDLFDIDYHSSGSARTEGFYKESFEQRRKWKQKLYDEKVRQGLPATIGVDQDYIDRYHQLQVHNKETESSKQADIRRIRQQHGHSNLTAYNQMNFRMKKVKFMRSLIHGWGLFALETIPADSMVIEYLGEVIRMSLCDHREEQNEKMGECSSYMFRINREQVVDATRHGNYARFVNHSCQPNCYAKVIQADNHEKIVIYSKHEIKEFEEITYDYKFPLEDEKIPCYCGAPTCRKYLN